MLSSDNSELFIDIPLYYIRTAFYGVGCSLTVFGIKFQKIVLNVSTVVNYKNCICLFPFKKYNIEIKCIILSFLHSSKITIKSTMLILIETVKLIVFNYDSINFI